MTDYIELPLRIGDQAGRSKAPVARDPINVEAQMRLDVCEDCDWWRSGKCSAVKECRNRPRPLADSGPVCPLGKWIRA